MQYRIVLALFLGLSSLSHAEDTLPKNEVFERVVLAVTKNGSQPISYDHSVTVCLSSQGLLYLGKVMGRGLQRVNRNPEFYTFDGTNPKHWRTYKPAKIAEDFSHEFYTIVTDYNPERGENDPQIGQLEMGKPVRHSEWRC